MAMPFPTIWWGTDEEVRCEATECRGLNASGGRLLDRIVEDVNELILAARALVGDLPTRVPDGTLTAADLRKVQIVLAKLPQQDPAVDSLFQFIRGNPDFAIRKVANDPKGFAKLVTDIRSGIYGAGDLITPPPRKLPVTPIVIGFAGLILVAGVITWGSKNR